MTDPFMDQVEAAKTETREKINRALGLPEGYNTNAASKPFLEEIFAAHVDDDRCQHLTDTPVQPWHWTALTKWACQPCTAAAWAVRRRQGPFHPTMGVIEELTCDRCRRYTPSGLKPAMLRIDFFVMTLGCCRRCYDEFGAQGGIERTVA